MISSISLDIVTIANKIDEALFTTLNNVSQQSYKAINHIIIYRHGTDKELKQLQSFAHQKNFHFYAQAGKGISSAFNDGINQGDGELVLFLNSGDTLVAENVIKKIIQSYTQQRWLWATGETISVSKKKYLKKHRQQHQTWRDNLFWYGNPLCHQSTVYSRQLIEQTGLYNESLSMGMDFEYNIRANKLANPTLLYFPIAYYDTTGVSSTRVFRQYTNHRRIRDRYFQLPWLEHLKVDLYCFIKALYRLAMVPAKLWL